jgi:hypothetical protein
MNSLSDLKSGDSCPLPPNYPNIPPLNFTNDSNLIGSDINDSQLKILTDISFLQDLEKDLYTDDQVFVDLSGHVNFNKNIQD